MSATNSKEISFVQSADDVTVKALGVTVEIHADGNVLVHTHGDVKKIPSIVASEPKIGEIMADDARRVNDRAAHASEPTIGAVMRDGTVFAGFSPDTGKPMHSMFGDVLLTMTFNEAADYAKQRNSDRYLGHDDWRLPTKNELNVLFNNRAAIGRFNVTGSDPASWYWSGSHDKGDRAWGQRFSDGWQISTKTDNRSSVRLVRSS